MAFYEQTRTHYEMVLKAENLEIGGEEDTKRHRNSDCWHLMFPIHNLENVFILPSHSPSIEYVFFTLFHAFFTHRYLIPNWYFNLCVFIMIFFFVDFCLGLSTFPNPVNIYPLIFCSKFILLALFVHEWRKKIEIAKETF